MIGVTTIGAISQWGTNSGRMSTSDLSAVKSEITPERFPRALLFAAAEAILVTREPVSVGPCRRWTVAIVVAARGINDRADAMTLILIHPIGMAPVRH
jgi:hypothetical protein